MPDPTNPPSSPDSAPVSGRDPKATRRRFLQGGLAAAPVLMTLVSRPVLAQQCTTPSGYVSLNASTAGRGVACLGRTPGYWKNTTAWPPPYKPTTTFDSVFAHNATYYPAATTLQDVLEPQIVGAGPPHDVARHIVAALLNVQSGWAPVLTAAVVKGMWGEYLSKGSFSPSSGTQWDHDQLMDYLVITMPL
jgi:hypothetical protein